VSCLDAVRVCCMGERVHIQRYPDRVSASFSEDADDVQCIMTVTFDNEAVLGCDDHEVTARARRKLLEYGQILAR
jgi:hypothetical protein